ncbi:hypothetical protein Bcav_3831 [Beutenbergia cavernae DSM 12333]|uniref:Uncharacterized protein n=1 Tax=Beutenbergia cavernae (strain ATCC BAA-8 / DSM 12333 / CCUG 43141 / JCM 11478 / NBRC 16432 / NCIMB 13614 / HKI 0122) TaxID=471853 RepID=C5C4E9_BEUC1|nr:hypothetical protein [Beutenbergia cavernae]ACQ82073.1 hypothetical protein Bcav_3831 [Beutenbergia cavernae DSM 12333]
MSFEAAMQALTDDANRWRTVAGELNSASTSAGGLGLAASQFSFAGATVSQTYENLRAHVQEVLSQGNTEITGAAAELDQVRTTYEGTDQAAKDRLNGTWNWN